MARTLLLRLYEGLQLLLEHLVLPSQLLDDLRLRVGADVKRSAVVVRGWDWKLLKHQILYIKYMDLQTIADHCCLHSGFYSSFFGCSPLVFLLGFFTASTSSLSSSSPSSPCSSSPSSPFSYSSSSLKQKQMALVQSWQSSLAQLQLSCTAVLESKRTVNMEASSLSFLYLISLLISLEGSLVSASCLVSTCSSKLEKYSVIALNFMMILMWLVLGSINQQENSLSLPRHSTSTLWLMSPSLSKTSAQKLGMAMGCTLLGSPLQGNPSGLQSLASTLFPSATFEICLQMGCFNNSYFSRMASIPSVMAALSAASSFLSEQMAFQLNSSFSGHSVAFCWMAASSSSLRWFSSSSSSGWPWRMASSSSSSYSSPCSCSSSEGSEGSFSFLVALPIRLNNRLSHKQCRTRGGLLANDQVGNQCGWQQFYMSLENREGEQNNSGEQSQSKHSVNRTHPIRKSPKPIKRPAEPLPFEKKESIFSSLRLSPQFGVFENEVQKQMRLEKFWRQEIDTYYKRHIDEHEKELLSGILEEEVPSLREVIETASEVLPTGKVPFEELYRYVELIRQLKSLANTLVLVESAEKHFLAVFEGNELAKMIEVSLEEAYLINKRQTFIASLQERQRVFNENNGTKQQLSEIATEIAFLLFLMKQNKVRINSELQKVYDRIINEPARAIKPAESVEDKYIACLIRKNLRIALANTEIDFLNYFANLDMLEQYGSIEADQLRTITDKREFEEYMKRKKSKKTRKNPKGVLKTACGGCLSPHHEQYNPFSYCSDCHVRFHKFCYSATAEGLCEPCSLKKSPQVKGRAIECQFCSNRGLLSLPAKSVREGVSIHIFCMLINGLWKLENGSLEFKSSNFATREPHDEVCTISTCNSTVYTYPCRSCSSRAHPLCAYLAGWNMGLDENDRVVLECCSAGLDREKQSYRRKFVLNYKKILYKAERER